MVRRTSVAAADETTGGDGDYFKKEWNGVKIESTGKQS
jgi:hypothetical protein